MESGEFKLQERTALIVGPCTTTTQAIAMTLTGYGCSVVMIDSNADQHVRFAERLMDAREVNPKAGRATAVSIDLKSPAGPKEAVGRAAEAFGGIDIYIDASLSFDAASFKDESTQDIQNLIKENFEVPVLISHHAMKFLEGRRRGRLVYLTYDLHRTGFPSHAVAGSARHALASFARSLAREAASAKVTVNCVAMGVTEEFLLSYGKGQLSIQAAQTELLKKFPDAQLTEADKIAQTVAFLVSSMSAGISGETLTVSQGLSHR